jgi:hypothetical protein
MYNYATATVVYEMFLLKAGWKIRPASHNAEVNFCGNLIIDGTEND